MTFESRCYVVTGTTGAVTLALGSAIAGYRAFPSSLDGLETQFTIEDGDAWEVSKGTYTHTGTTLTRTLIKSSTGSLLNLTGNAKVFSDISDEALNSMFDNRRVMVNTVGDFPTAVSGTITLDSTKYYQLNASLTLTDSIDLNDSKILSPKRSGATLTFSPTTGSLFVGAEGGDLENIGMTAPNGTASVFNIDNVDADKVLNVISCFIFGSASLGTIEGLSGLRFERCFWSGNTDGLIIQDVAALNDFSRNVIPDTNTGTQMSFVGTFQRINFSGGAHTVASGSTTLDITGITSLGEGVISGGIWSGDGTKVNGLDSNGHFPLEWEAEGAGLITSKDAVSGGDIYVDSADAIETTISTVDTPVKLAGTTTANTSSLFRFTHTNGRLTYNGLTTVDMPVFVTASIVSASNNQLFSIFIAKNGTVDESTRSNGKVGTGTDEIAITSQGLITFEIGDYVEAFIENRTGTANFTGTVWNMAVR